MKPRVMVGGAVALLLYATPAWAYGRLDIQAAQPEARLWVDGAPAGTLPTLLDLRAGKHRIRVTAPGYPAKAYTVTIRDGVATPYRVSLAARPHVAAHHVTPHHAAVVKAPVVAARPPVKQRPVVVAKAPAPVAAAPIPRPAAVVPPAPVNVAPVLAGKPLAPPPAAMPALPVASMHPTEPDVLDEQSWHDLLWLSLLALLAGLAAAKLSTTVAAPEDWQPRREARTVQAPEDEHPTDHTAWAYLAMGDWDGAVRTLWKRLNENGGTAWAYYHLGLAYERLGRDYEAESAYRAALQADPAYEAAAFNLGALLDREGERVQAAIAYRKLLESHPTDADALVNLGHVYRELGMPRQAEVHWRAARQLSPRDRAVRDDLRRLRMELRRGA